MLVLVLVIARAVAAPPVEPAWVGVVVAQRAVELSALAGGVVRIERGVGARVGVGEEVGRIGAPTEASDLAQARAAVQAAEAAASGAAVEVAHAERERADLAGLAAAGVGAPAEVDRASVALEGARAAERAARAAVAERRAAVERVLAEQAGGHLVAGFAGTVAAWHARDGEWVDAGAPVVRLTEGLAVRFAVPVEEGAGIEGRQVEVEVSAGPPVGARVVRVAPELDPASQRLFVEATLVGGPGALVAGQACEVRPR